MAASVQVFAVVRIDGFIEGDDAITVQQVLPTEEHAEAEVARLNDLNRDKGSRYFWMATRYYPGGPKRRSYAAKLTVRALARAQDSLARMVRSA